MATEAERVLARGIEVELADGKHVLRFDLDALEHLESEYGSLAEFIDAWNAAAQKGWQAIRVRTVRIALEAALRHEGVQSVGDLVTPAMLRPPSELVRAINDALDEAFPAESEAPAAGKELAEENASTGATSTTSARSSSAAPTTSSAA